MRGAKEVVIKEQSSLKQQ